MGPVGLGGYKPCKLLYPNFRTFSATLKAKIRHPQGLIKASSHSAQAQPSKLSREVLEPLLARSIREFSPHCITLLSIAHLMGYSRKYNKEPYYGNKEPHFLNRVHPNVVRGVAYAWGESVRAVARRGSMPEPLSIGSLPLEFRRPDPDSYNDENSPTEL
jgi:hypothetical protein